MVDFSSSLSDIFSMLFQWLADFFNLLDSIIILPHLSLLKLIIIIVVLSMILSAVFVMFDGGYDD